jgi:hypothetical protein
MKVCEIVSDADFKIKICKSEYNPAEHILDMIKSKMRDKKRISSEDLHVLARLPMICEKKGQKLLQIGIFQDS